MTQASIAICLLSCSFAPSSTGAESTKVSIAEVKEILRSRCADCHRAEASSTDFDVLIAESLIKANVVKIGKPEESKLMEVIVSEVEEIRMPRDLPALSPSEIDRIHDKLSTEFMGPAGMVQSTRSPGTLSKTR